MNDDETAAAPSISVTNLPPTTTTTLTCCLGTRRLTNLRHKHDSCSTGMIATFMAHADNEAPYLLVLLTDGTTTFQGHIHPSQAKRVQWNNHIPANEQPQDDISDEIKVQILSCFLLQDQDGMTVTYTYLQPHTDEMEFSWKSNTRGVPSRESWDRIHSSLLPIPTGRLSIVLVQW